MVKILTDSSADISNEYLLKHSCLDIIQIPLTHLDLFCKSNSSF